MNFEIIIKELEKEIESGNENNLSELMNRLDQTLKLKKMVSEKIDEVYMIPQHKDNLKKELFGDENERQS